MLSFLATTAKPFRGGRCLGHCGNKELDLLQQIGIGRLLYARHCGIPNYTFSLTIKKSLCEERGWLLGAHPVQWSTAQPAVGSVAPCPGGPLSKRGCQEVLEQMGGC